MGILDNLIKDGILMFTPVGDIVSNGVSILSSGLDKIITSIDKANKKKIEKYVASLNNAPFFLISLSEEYKSNVYHMVSHAKLPFYNNEGEIVGIIELKHKKCIVNYNSRRIASIVVKEKFLSSKEIYTITYANQTKDTFICENGTYHAYHKLVFTSDRCIIKQDKDSSSSIITKEGKNVARCKRVADTYIITYEAGREREALVLSCIPLILFGKGSYDDVMYEVNL